MNVNYDLLVHIANHLSEPLTPHSPFPAHRSTIKLAYQTLYSLSLVSRACSSAAAKVLYQRVVVSPKGDARNVLDLKRLREGDVLPDQFRSALLPHNAPFVLRLEVSGYLSTRPPPPSTDTSLNFPDSLAHAITKWQNLRYITFTPTTLHDEVFSPALRALSSSFSSSSVASTNHFHLRHLHINSAAGIHSPPDVLTSIVGLETLTIDDPNRTLRDVLPTWVGKLESTLTGLHLKNNCGSITPGVLRLLKPHVRRLRAFTLGLSYSITNDDLFDFLGCLPELEELDVRYYLQNKPLPPLPSTFLARLRSITLRYAPLDVETPSAKSMLRTWLSTVLTYALSNNVIETVAILMEKGFYSGRHELSGVFEDLLRMRDSTTYDDYGDDDSGDSGSEQERTKSWRGREGLKLKRVWMPHAFVSADVVRELSERCGGLEELCVNTNSEVLGEIPVMARTCPKLHTIVLRLVSRDVYHAENLAKFAHSTRWHDTDTTQLPTNQTSPSPSPSPPPPSSSSSSRSLSSAMEGIRDVLLDGQTRLCRVAVNDYLFEASWRLTSARGAGAGTGGREPMYEGKYVVEGRELEGDEWSVESDDDDNDDDDEYDSTSEDV